MTDLSDAETRCLLRVKQRSGGHFTRSPLLSQQRRNSNIKDFALVPIAEVGVSAAIGDVREAFASTPPIGRQRNDAERFLGAFRHPFFEVCFYPAHLIGHVGEANAPARPRALCKRVERGRFHLDRENSGLQRRLDCLLGFAKRGIGRPAGSAVTDTPALASASCAISVRCESPSLYSDGGM